MGTANLDNSRRTKNAECKYWIRNEDNSISSSAYILKHQASGTFDAEEISPWFNQKGVAGGVFMYNKNTIMLETDDDIDEISAGDIVLYNGKTWNVVDNQKVLHKKQSEFDNEMNYKYIVSIRR